MKVVETVAIIPSMRNLFNPSEKVIKSYNVNTFFTYLKAPIKDDDNIQNRD